MTGTSAWDYIFIRTSIFLLHLVAPFSVIYSLASWLSRFPFHVPHVLEVWLAFETSFYLLIYLPRKAYLQAAATHPTAACRNDRQRLFWHCHGNIPDPDRFLTKWFRDAPAAEIKRDNVKEFYRWAFLNTAEPDPAYDEELEYYVGEMEKSLGRILEPGRGNAKCLRLTLDNVEMLHRSLIWYLCVSIVDTIASISLRYYSFDFYRTSMLRYFAVFPLRIATLFNAHRSPAKTLTYWYRRHTSKTKLPILFIHGIGIGLYPYVQFLADINTAGNEDSLDGQVGIIAVEMMPISSRITAQAMLKDEMCDEIHCILKAHGWGRFALVSHSYGSVVAAHLLRTPRIAQAIGPVMFIDPVTFLLHLPDVAYNFVYRKPSHANEYLLSYFGSKDMGISHTLSRRFFWIDNVLWKEDMQRHRVTVVLAGRDAIVDTKAIGAYLTGAEDWSLGTGSWEGGFWKGDGLDVLWFQDLDHGQVFNRKRAREKLVDIVRSFSSEE